MAGSGSHEGSGGRPLIRIEEATRRFGDVAAVDRLSLDIQAGEMFCLLGGSGSGKTTLMRMIAGFEEPDGGRILLDGQDLAGTPPHRRPVNMMFQSYALFPHLSVADNVGFGLRLAGMPRLEIERRVRELLDLVQLGGLERRKPDQLSGGQRQRVALARALARRPRVLLLDEPLGALDKKTREETQIELINIQRELGATFIVVTHDHEEAMVMASRIGVMEAGRLVQVGSPHEIYETPATRSVAQLIGDINLIPARAASTSREGVCRFEAAHFAGGLEVAGVGRAFAPGEEVSVAVRPEKLAIASAEEQGLPNVATGVVAGVAYLGDWTMHHVRLADGSRIRVSRANAERFRGAAIQTGEAVSVRFGPDAAVVLTR